MGKKWTWSEEQKNTKELKKLYIVENKTINEIAKKLNLGQSTVYDRLLRLHIKPIRSKKLGFNNKRQDIHIPDIYSDNLAEFVGIMLGDGHLTKTQVAVTLGDKEDAYVNYVAKIIEELFSIKPRILKSRSKYNIVYFGSVDVVRWLIKMGLVFNKVKNQVKVPHWIFLKKSYIKNFLRGFFDTDGSIYKLKYGVQISFTNRSIPLLQGTQNGLSKLGLSPSNISQYKIYLTKKVDLLFFFEKINPANKKHIKRYNTYCRCWDTQAVNEGRL